MTFKMRNSNTSIPRELNLGQKVAETIDLEPAKLKDHGGHFLYYPSKISTDSVETIQQKTTEDYLKTSSSSNVFLPKPEYEKEDIVFDPNIQKWKLVKESEMYK